MKKTVLCHFYNEEWLLPWWLQHHRQYFDHGIMIDYHSSDNSKKIIQDLCPSWDIITTRNKDFNPDPVDREVEELEKQLVGWRVCLNVPEFLVGNYNRLSDVPNPTNIYVETTVFIEPGTKENPTRFDRDLNLINQCSWIVPRARSGRSIHNYPVKYPEGRHYFEPGTFNDLKLYYFGWASLETASIKRRMQIQTKTPVGIDPLSPHRFTEQELLEKFEIYRSNKIEFSTRL